MFDFPMCAFCLHGYNGDKVELNIYKVLGFPNETSYEGGYDIVCELEICVGCYYAKESQHYSATGALYNFCDELKICYENLSWIAEYKLLLENDLSFQITMLDRGTALIQGNYQERPM